MYNNTPPKETVIKSNIHFTRLFRQRTAIPSPMAPPTKRKRYLIFIAAVVTIASATDTGIIPYRNQDVSVAIEEMQKANYFTFVTLIDMVPTDLIEGNVTFLMPNDKTLARDLMPETSAARFLQLHSIPSPLLLEDLEHFPTGSLVPTLSPDVFLRINNNSRRHFFLNNVRIASPNICTRGTSIRCHGIDAVILQTEGGAPSPPPPSPPDHGCSLPNSSLSVACSPISPPRPPLPAPSIYIPPPPVDSEGSSASGKTSRADQRIHFELPSLILLITCLTLMVTLR